MSHRLQLPLGLLGKVGMMGMLTLGAIQGLRVPKVNLVRVVAKAMVLSGRTRLARPARVDDQSHPLGALLRRRGEQQPLERGPEQKVRLQATSAR